MNTTPTLSIITPTYNRANLLKRCFSSLQIQTSKDFEWLIVDDGSTDNTEYIVSTFSGDFEILYIKKENGGKHTALNASHAHIHGQYVLILDSDDYLIPEAVEKVIRGWKEFENNKTVGIVTFLRGKSVEAPFCRGKYERIPVDILRSERIFYLSRDCCEVIKSSLFKKYPFPVFKGERFLSEGALWNRVSFDCKCVYINEVVYIGEYLEEGLTKSGRKMRIKNPRGGMYAARLNMHKKNYPRNRIKNSLLYNCYGFFAGMSPAKIVTHNRYKLLTLVGMLPGWLLFLVWSRMYE